MIRISRPLERPAVLAGPSQTRNAYRHQTVIGALSQMQHGKCCYCEKYIATQGHERAVEHFRPKDETLYPHLINEWTNLLHACAACNGKKGNKFPLDSAGNPLLIDPSDPNVDPEDHLAFNTDDDEDEINFGRVVAKDGSSIGSKTVETIGLDLVQRRRERLSSYKDLYAAFVEIKLAKDETTRAQKVAAFEAMLARTMNTRLLRGHLPDERNWTPSLACEFAPAQTPSHRSEIFAIWEP